jgi:hypothetical protein
MHEQMRRAFGEWIDAECTKGPVVIVLEDLHWGDPSSVEYVIDALRRLGERPLMVVAFARPEVHEALPRLRLQAGLFFELALGTLTRRAAERLIRAALGDSASRETVQAIVDRAAGNAFYVEELVRSAAEGRSRELPESVLAMVESRLARLESEAREVLRAASVFGTRFWVEGVCTLVANAGDWMEPLVAREMIEASPSTRFAGETEYAFRHALVRDAAYAMLTASGREAAHRSAAAWLERSGETEPLAIAVQYEHAGDRLAAAPWLLQAAKNAYRAGAIEQMVSLCDRGLVEGIPANLELELLRYRCAAPGYFARWSEAAVAGRDLMRRCEPGTVAWMGAASTVLSAAQNGDVSGVPDVVAGVASMQIQPAATREWGISAGLLLALFAEFGQREMALRVKERLDATPIGQDVDPAFLGYQQAAGSSFSDLTDDPAGQLAGARAALRSFEHAGDELGLLSARAFALPAALSNVGHYAAARQMADAAAAAALARGLDYLHDLAVFQAEVAAATAGDRTALQRILARRRDSSNVNLQAYLLFLPVLAELANSPVDLEALAGAEAEAREWLKNGLVFPRARAWNTGFLALAAVARGAWSEALSLANSVLAERGLGYPRTEALVARAQALHSLGRLDEAREAIAGARSRVFAQADRFADASDRDVYLARQFVSRTLALAAEWLNAGRAGDRVLGT